MILFSLNKRKQSCVVYTWYYSLGISAGSTVRRLCWLQRLQQLFMTSDLILGNLRSDDCDGNENAKKAIGLITKTTILHIHHAFLYISLPSLHDYDVKMPNFTLYRGSTHQRRRNFLFISELGYCSQEFNFRSVHLHSDEDSELE